LSVAVAGELPEILQRKILTGDAARDEYGPGRDFQLVFTNGCFDILHRGHVQLLVQARELGDCLLVGLKRDVVEAGGGKIVILPYIEGLSTTELLERVHRMNLP
jgi:cytidyltransferase-like protein